MMMNLQAWLQHASQSWLPLALDASLKGSAVLAFAGAVALGMRRASASAAARQAVWLLALAGLPALPVLSLALPGWRVLPKWAQIDLPSARAEPAVQSDAASASAIPGAPDEDITVAPGQAPAAPAEGGHAASELPAAPPAPPAAASPPPAAPGRESPWQVKVLPWAMAIWMLGVAATLAPLLLGWLGLWVIRRAARPVTDGQWQALLERAKAALGLRRKVLLLESPGQAMPMIWGLLAPRLLLPAEADGWSDQRKRVVLLHELGHVKRWDCATKLLAHLTCGLYWFNPLAWLAFVRLQAEAETACDDLVLASGHEPCDYADHLLHIASGLRSGVLAAHSSIAMARKSKLEGRLLAILDGRRNRRSLTRLGLLLAAVVVTALVIPLSIMKATAGEKGADAAATQPDTQPGGAAGLGEPVALAKHVAMAKLQLKQVAMKKVQEAAARGQASASQVEQAQVELKLAELAVQLIECQAKGDKAGGDRTRVEAAKVELDAKVHALHWVKEGTQKGTATEVEVEKAQIEQRLAELAIVLLESEIKGDKAAYDSARLEAAKVQLQAKVRALHWVKEGTQKGTATEVEVEKAQLEQRLAELAIVLLESEIKGDKAASGRAKLEAAKLHLQARQLELRRFETAVAAGAASDADVQLAKIEAQIAALNVKLAEHELQATRPAPATQPAPSTSSGPSTQPAWGEVVEGFAMRLRPADPLLRPDGWPGFLVDFRNAAKRKIEVVFAPESIRLEVDGVWYRPAAIALGRVPAFLMGPGEDRVNVPFWPAVHWAWRAAGGDPLLPIKPGKHAFRLAFAGLPKEVRGERAVEVFSNVLEVTIPPPATQPAPSTSSGPSTQPAAKHSVEIRVTATLVGRDQDKLNIAITQEHIRLYDWASHTVHLRGGLTDSWLRKVWTGRFEVVVDGESLYGGGLTSMLSSISPKGPFINVGPTAGQSQPQDAIRICPPQPAGQPDPRNDSVLKLALRDLGLLKDGPAPDSPTTAAGTQPASRAKLALKQVEDAIFQAALQARVGKVVEVTLKIPEVDRSAAFVDFDAGKIIALPANMDLKDRAGIWAWASQNGVDAVADLRQEIRGLLGFGLVVQQVMDKDWDAATPERAATAIAHREFVNFKMSMSVSDPMAQSVISANTISTNPNISRTYAIRTREGSLGIIQLLAFTDEPGGMLKLQFKLLKAPLKSSTTAAGTQPASRPSRF